MAAKQQFFLSMNPSIEHKISVFAGGESFAVIYLSKGTSSVTIAGVRRVIAAPCCICLSEKETFCCDAADVEGFTVRFLPSHLNSALTFNNLTGSKTGLPESAVLDRYFLRPFFERDDSYHGFFSPGPETDIAIRSRSAVWPQIMKTVRLRSGRAAAAPRLWSFL
jgi:hypothetical protein